MFFRRLSDRVQILRIRKGGVSLTTHPCSDCYERGSITAESVCPVHHSEFPLSDSVGEEERPVPSIPTSRLPAVSIFAVPPRAIGQTPRRVALRLHTTSWRTRRDRVHQAMQSRRYTIAEIHAAETELTSDRGSRKRVGTHSHVSVGVISSAPQSGHCTSWVSNRASHARQW